MADKKQQINTTNDFVDVADIKESVAILKDGSLRSVIEVGSINFELKSPNEQAATISAFQDFLNSVDFTLQVIIISRKLDINPYLTYLDSLTGNIQHELLKIQAIEYSRFVKGLTELANILSKKFYIVIPFVVILKTAGGKGVLSIFKSLASPSTYSKSLTEDEFRAYKMQLDQRIDLVMSGIGRLGINARVLDKEELLNLYKSLYNPT
ncbi:MAG: hypothetical protein Q8Q06_01825 [bacterium]|nr:hypothetical protein [bacterium]